MRTDTFGGLRAVVAGGTDGDGGGTGPLVVLLHGFGAPGTDLVSLCRVIDAPRGTRWLFPAAPLDLPMFGGDARAWWMIDMARLQAAMLTGRPRDFVREVPEGLVPARERVIALLDEAERKLAVPAGQTLLGGFSQGAMLSLDVALRTERPLAGLALMSGTLLAEHEWSPLMPARKGLRVMQSHGREDPILPYPVAEALRDKLTDAGVRVDFVPFRGGHGIPENVLDAFGRLARDVLAG